VKHGTQRRMPGRRLVNLEARQSVRLDQVITPSTTPVSARRSTTTSGDRGGFVIANRSRHHDAVWTWRMCLWRARVVIHCWLRALTETFTKRTLGRNDEGDEAAESKAESGFTVLSGGRVGHGPRRAGEKVDKTCVARSSTVADAFTARTTPRPKQLHSVTQTRYKTQLPRHLSKVPVLQAPANGQQLGPTVARFIFLLLLR
jgi:hypothetical protein